MGGSDDFQESFSNLNAHQNRQGTLAKTDSDPEWGRSWESDFSKLPLAGATALAPWTTLGTNSPEQRALSG